MGMKAQLNKRERERERERDIEKYKEHNIIVIGMKTQLDKKDCAHVNELDYLLSYSLL